MSLLTSEQYATFIELMESNKTNREVRATLGFSESQACRFILFYRMHGKEEFYQYHVLGERPKRQKDDLRGIAEYLHVNGIAVDRGAIMFKVSRGFLYDLLEERRQTGKPLAEPVSPPTLHGPEAEAEKKALEAGAKRKGEGERAASTSRKRLGREDIVSRSFELPDDYSSLPEPVQPRMGRALSPVPTGRGKRKMRNRTVEAQNKEQRLLRKAQAEGNDKKQSTGTIGDIIDKILGPFPKGTPAKEWKPGKGQRCDIDIYSEGFGELPFDVREKAYKIHAEKHRVREAAGKKLSALILDGKL